MDDLKKLIEKIDSKLDKVDERLNSVDVTLVKQNADLEHHIYRTSIAEQRIEILQSQVDPLSKVHQKVEGAFKLIGIVATGLGLMVAIGKLIVVLL